MCVGGGGGRMRGVYAWRVRILCTYTVIFYVISIHSYLIYVHIYDLYIQNTHTHTHTHNTCIYRWAHLSHIPAHADFAATTSPPAQRGAGGGGARGGVARDSGFNDPDMLRPTPKGQGGSRSAAARPSGWDDPDIDLGAAGRRQGVKQESMRRGGGAEAGTLGSGFARGWRQARLACEEEMMGRQAGSQPGGDAGSLHGGRRAGSRVSSHASKEEEADTQSKGPAECRAGVRNVACLAQGGAWGEPLGVVVQCRGRVSGRGALTAREEEDAELDAFCDCRRVCCGVKYVCGREFVCVCVCV
jgi:hypothetical protein